MTLSQTLRRVVGWSLAAVLISSCTDDKPSGGTGGAAGVSGSGTNPEATAGGGGTAGFAGSAGAGGTPPLVRISAAPPGCTLAWTGSATRPLLTDEAASCFTIQRYLAQAGPVAEPVTDDWDPSAGLPSASTYAPAYTVAADGSGTHTTVQAAITDANAAGGTDRVHILVKPGTYRELVCVTGTVPITLYGADEDPAQVTIAFDNANGKTVDTAYTNACVNPSGATYGTNGSTTFFVSSAAFQAQNLTIANDFSEASQAFTSLQAVAMTTNADQLVFQNVRFLGNQDTLQVRSPAGSTISRSYFKNCYVDGDTDFVFGRGTAVFDGCTITYLGARKKNSAHFAPSTEGSNPFGLLIINSRIVGDAMMPGGTALLGRAWDDSSAPTANGQLVIRNSEIGDHIRIANPWTTAATSGRPFDANTNRLYEYQNTGLGAAP